MINRQIDLNQHLFVCSFIAIIFYILFNQILLLEIHYPNQKLELKSKSSRELTFTHTPTQTEICFFEDTERSEINKNNIKSC